MKIDIFKDSYCWLLLGKMLRSCSLNYKKHLTDLLIQCKQQSETVLGFICRIQQVNQSFRPLEKFIGIYKYLNTSQNFSWKLLIPFLPHAVIGTQAPSAVWVTSSTCSSRIVCSPNCTHLFLAVGMFQFMAGPPNLLNCRLAVKCVLHPKSHSPPSHGLPHFLPSLLPLCWLECGCPCHSVGRLLPKALRRVWCIGKDVGWYRHPLVRLWWLSCHYVVLPSSIINKAQMFVLLFKMTL